MIKAGTATVQLARNHGMVVIGTVGTPEGEKLVHKAGAHFVFNHRSPGYMDKVKVKIFSFHFFLKQYTRQILLIFKTISNYWMRQSMIQRIIQTEEADIRQSCTLLHCAIEPAPGRSRLYTMSHIELCDNI